MFYTSTLSYFKKKGTRSPSYAHSHSKQTQARYLSELQLRGLCGGWRIQLLICFIQFKCKHAGVTKFNRSEVLTGRIFICIPGHFVITFYL